MDLEKEHENWNVECTKPILVRCSKLLHNDFGMEEAPENGKESSHSAHINGMNE